MAGARQVHVRIVGVVVTDRRPLQLAAEVYLDAHNDEPKPFRWTKTADEILESIARFATRTSTAHPGAAS